MPMTDWSKFQLSPGPRVDGGFTVVHIVRKEPFEDRLVQASLLLDERGRLTGSVSLGADCDGARRARALSLVAGWLSIDAECVRLLAPQTASLPEPWDTIVPMELGLNAFTRAVAVARENSARETRAYRVEQIHRLVGHLSTADQQDIFADVLAKSRPA